MDIREMLLGRIDEPQQIDYSQGIQNAFTAADRGMSATNLREKLLADSTRRHENRLGIDQRAMDESYAITGGRPQSSDNVKALSIEQRYKNYQAGLGDDPELAFDIEHMDNNYIRAKYGNGLANILANQYDEQLRNLSRASNYLPESQRPQGMAQEMASTGKGILGGIGSGVNNVLHWGMTQAAMAQFDGEEEAEMLRQISEGQSETAGKLAEWQGAGYTHNHEKNKLSQNIAEQVRQREFERIAGETGNTEFARKQSNHLAEQVNDDLIQITKELIVNGIGEQAPQIALAIASGGAGSAVALATTNGIARTVATQAIGKALLTPAAKRLTAQLGSMVGVGTVAGLQDGSSAASEAMVGAYDYFKQVKAEAANGDSTRYNQLMSSPVIQQLRRENPNATDEQLMQIAAENARNNAGLASGLFTGASAGIASPFLSGFSSRLAAGFRPSTRAAMGLTSPITEAVSEGAEEYVNQVAPRVAVNRALGVDVYDDPTLYAETSAKQAALIAGVTGGGSAIGSVGQLGAVAVNKGREVISDKVRNRTQKQENQEAKEVADTATQFIDTMNVFGTSTGTASDGTKQEAVDGVLGVNMSNSNFGKAYKEFVSEFTKATGKEQAEYNDYGSVIVGLERQARNNKEQAEVARKAGNTEEAERLDSLVQDWEESKSQLRNAMQEDIDKVSPEFTERYNRVNNAGNAVTTLVNDFQNGKISEEEFKPKYVAAMQEHTDAVNSFNEIQDVSEKIFDLGDTVLYQTLFDDESVAETVPDANKVKVSDFTDRKIKSFSDVLHSAQQIADNPEQIENQEAAESLISDWLKQANESGRKLNVENAKRLFDDFKSGLSKLNTAVKSRGFDISGNSVLGSILEDITNFTPANNAEAKVMLDKYFGSRSLLAFADNPKATKQVEFFAQSQLAKAVQLSEALVNNQDKVDSEGYFVDSKGNRNPVEVDIKTQDKKDKVKFNTLNQLLRYKSMVESDADTFNKTLNVIRSKGKKAKVIENIPTKPEPKSVPKAKQETATESKTSEPVADKATSKLVSKVQERLDKYKNRQPKTLEHKPYNKFKADVEKLISDGSITDKETIDSLRKQIADLDDAIKASLKPKETKSKQEEIVSEPVEENEETVEEFAEESTEEVVEEVTEENPLVSKDTKEFIKINRDELNTKLPEAFSKMKAKFSGDERTSNDWGLNDTPVKHGLSEKALHNLFLQGYSPDMDLFAEYTNKTVEINEQEITKAFADFGSNPNKENIAKLAAVFNPNLNQEQIDKLVDANNIESTINTLVTFAELHKQLDAYLRSSKTFLARNASSNVLPELSHYNAMTYLLDKPDALVMSMTKALMSTMMDSMLSGNPDRKALEEFFKKRNSDNNDDVKINETSLINKSISYKNEKGQIFKQNNKTVAETLGFKDGNYSELNLNGFINEDLGNIGIQRGMFIEKLGQNMLNALGVKLKSSAPDSIRSAIIGSLGGELFGILDTVNLITSYKVIFSGDDSLNYSNFIFNDSYSKMLPIAASKGYRQRIRNAITGESTRNNTQDKSFLFLDNASNYDKNKKSTDTGWFTTTIKLAEVRKAVAASMLFERNVEDTERVLSFRKVGEEPVDNFEPRHVSDVLINSNPKELEESVRNHNKIAYKFQPQMVRLFETDRIAWRRMVGWVSPSEYVGDSAYYKARQDAINNRVEREEVFLLDALKQAREVDENLNNVNVYAPHTTTETQRIQMNLGQSMQNDKAIREFLFADNSSIVEAQTNATKKKGKFEYDVSDNNGLIAPVTTEFTLPVHNGKRDISFLVQQVETLRTAKDSLNKTAYHNQASILLGLAQALGIKVEKLRSENIINKLENIFRDPNNSWLEEFVDNLYEMSQDKEVTLKPELVDKFVKSEFNTMRAVSMLQAYAQYKHGANGAVYAENFYLEADGIGNGMSNLLRQFTVGFTPTYIQTMKRVGITTLDMLVQKMNKLGWDFENLTGKDRDELISQLEGSADNFNSKDNAKVDDVYEVVANKIQDAISKGLTDAKQYKYGEDINNFLANNNIYTIITTPVSKNPILIAINALSLADNKSKVYLQEEPNKGIRDELTNLYGSLQSLAQLALLDATEITENGSVSSLHELLGRRLPELGDVRVEVKRSLAKLGVTPAMYGASINGITNQLVSDITAKIHEHLNVMHKKLHAGQKINPAYVDVVFAVLKSLGLSNAPKELTTETINKIDNLITLKTSVIHSRVQRTLGSIMHNGIQDVYGEFLGNASSLIATNNAIINQISQEVFRRFKTAIETRNKQYPVGDSRRMLDLTNKEKKEILLSMNDIPVFATAYSNNDTLIDDLLKSGHSISKTLVLDHQLPVSTGTNIVGIPPEQLYPYYAQYSISQKLNAMLSGGATIFTNSVVSTESKVQTAVIGSLRKLGLAVLDVFDGIDANGKLKDLVGWVANQAYNDVHLNTNLQESFFHVLNRSNLRDALNNKFSVTWLYTELFNKQNSIQTRIASMTRSLSSMNDAGDLYLTTTSMDVNPKDLNQLDAFMGLIASLRTYDVNGKSFAPYAIAASNLRNKIQEAQNNMLKQQLQGILNPEVRLTMSASTLADVGSGIALLMENGLDHVDNINEFGVELYNLVLKHTADKVATVHGIKAVEKKALSYNVNQFAGANRGVLVNPDALFKKEGIATRFAKFAEDRLNTEDMNTDYETLSEFLNTDPELVGIREIAKKQKLKELKLNLMPVKDNKYDKQIETIKNAKTISDLRRLVQGSGTIAESVSKVIIDLAISHNPDAKVFTDEEEFRKHTGYSRKLYNGLWDVASQSLYVNIGSRNPNAVATVLHELGHSFTASAFRVFYGLNKGVLTDTQEAAIKRIEDNAIRFADLMKSDSTVQELLDNPDMEIADYYKRTPAAAIAAGITRAMNTGNAVEKWVALSEFYSYAVTNHNVLSTMYYRRAANQKGILKKLLDILTETKKHLATLFFGSKASNSTKKIAHTSMLFDILAASFEVATFGESTIEINNTPDNTYALSERRYEEPHHNYLASLRNAAVDSGIVDKLKQSISVEKNILVQKTLDAVLPNNYLANIRSAGIKVDAEEAKTFALMSSLFSLTLTDAEPALRTEAEKYLDNVMSKLKDEFTDEQYKAIFGGNKDFSLADTMALAVTNNQVKTVFESVADTGGKFTNLVNKLTNSPFFNNASRSIVGFKDKNTLERIAYATASYDITNRLDNEREERIIKEEEDRFRRGVDFARKVKVSTSSLPKSFSETLSTLAIDWATSRDLNGTGNDTDSLIGRFLTNVAEDRAAKAGMPTWFTQALRWVLQARANTQYIYSRRNQYAGQNEQVRENVRNVIPNVIISAFGEDVYNKEIDNVISKTVMPLDLSRVFAGKVDIDYLGSMLKSEATLSKEINGTIKSLEETLNSKYGNNANKILNFIKWQANGLSDLMMNRTAKAVTENSVHFILPNSKAISSLKFVEKALKLNLNQEDLNNNIDTLDTDVGKLASLYALSKLDKTDKDKLNTLLKEHPKGMKAVLTGQDSVIQYSNKGFEHSLLGSAGYVHSQSDPNVHIQILHKNNPEISKLKKLGYKEESYLGNNYVVLKTNVSPVSRYQSGMFGIAESSVQGVSTQTNEPLHSFSSRLVLTESEKQGYDNLFVKTVNQAMSDSNYYDNLKSSSSIKPVITATGDIERYSIDLPTELKQQLVHEIDTGIEAIGNMHGRIQEENLAIAFNRENIHILNQAYNKDRNKQNYIKIDGKFKPLGNTPAQIKFAERINSFYFSLPTETRNDIDNAGGLYVYRNELDNIIGYHSLSWTDILTGKSGLPKSVQDIVKNVAQIFGMDTGKTLRTMKTMENAVQEITSLSKDVILIKSLTVALGNITGNVIHLLNVGVPIKEIVPLIKEGVIASRNYTRNNSKLIEVNYKLRYADLSGPEKMKLEKEQQFLVQSLQNNPVGTLVHAGIMSSISGAVGYDTQFDTADEFTYRRKLIDYADSKLNFKNHIDNRFGSAMMNLAIMQGSKAHDVLTEVLDLGDFVAKYALFKHLTKNRGFDETRAMNVIREEFVNYSMNRGAVFDYANATGLSWFASYALGIQKIIYRSLRKNPLSTLAIYTAGKSMDDYDKLGLLNTVPMQNALEKNWDYMLSPSNIIGGFENHYLTKLMSGLFD